MFCFYLWYNKAMKNTQITKTCTICNEPYKVKAYRAENSKYCSRECWQQRNPPNHLICKFCHKPFDTYQRGQLFCSRSCARKGTRGNNYKDGKSLLRQRGRDSHKLIEWRKAVYTRDHYTCQHCGVVGRRLHAHHIVLFSENEALRFELTNGITLCVPCHEKVHGRKLSAPSKYPKNCVDCGKKIKGVSLRCRSCSLKEYWRLQQE